MALTNNELFFDFDAEYKLILNSEEIYAENFNELIKDKLTMNIGGKCNEFGYVKKESIKVKKVSSIILENGLAHCIISYSCKLLNPKENNIIKTKIFAINKSGMEGILSDENVYDRNTTPIIININREFNIDIDNEYYNSIKENDIIYVEVLISTYELNDEKIYSSCILRPDLANKLNGGNFDNSIHDESDNESDNEIDDESDNEIDN